VWPALNVQGAGEGTDVRLSLEGEQEVDLEGPHELCIRLFVLYPEG
jgi:hypothetical protein